MTPLITKPLSKAEASAIFAENAVFLGGSDAIEIHRIVELFGEQAAIFIEENARYGRCMDNDLHLDGFGTLDDPLVAYFYFPGFLKVIAEHNLRLQLVAHRQSEGGAVWDRLWEERCKRLAEQDARDEAELEARRQKRRKKKADNADTPQ